MLYNFKIIIIQTRNNDCIIVNSMRTFDKL